MADSAFGAESDPLQILDVQCIRLSGCKMAGVLAD
jgi:hypothetical protein